MNDIREVVDLPDPRVQPLVHPLDLPAARKHFAAWWWLAWLVHPTVFLALAVALWQVGNVPVIVLLVPTFTLTCAAFAERYYAREAWAFIPRKRQDTARPLPLPWELAGALLHALLLGVAIVWGVQWLVRSGVSASVGAYTTGTGLAVAMLMLGAFLKKITDAVSGKQHIGRLVVHIPGIAVVLGTCLYGYGKLSTEYNPSQWRTTDMVTGAVVLLAVQLVWWLIDTRGSKRAITA